MEAGSSEGMVTADRSRAGRSRGGRRPRGGRRAFWERLECAVFQAVGQRAALRGRARRLVIDGRATPACPRRRVAARTRSSGPSSGSERRRAGASSSVARGAAPRHTTRGEAEVAEIDAAADLPAGNDVLLRAPARPSTVHTRRAAWIETRISTQGPRRFAPSARPVRPSVAARPRSPGFAAHTIFAVHGTRRWPTSRVMRAQ